MRNKLFVGNDQTRMLQDALTLARDTLGSDNLDVHPDYLLIKPSKKSIGVEEILPVVNKGVNRAVLAPVSVVIINGFDALTVAAQNKLLLTLEANTNVLVIGIAASLASVLDTVKSRMEIVEYRKASRQEFSEFPDPMLAYNSFCGDLNLAKRNQKHMEMLQQIVLDISQNHPENLLKTLHLLEEKDPDAVTGDHDLMGIVLQALKHSLTEAGIASAEAGNIKKTVVCCDLVERLNEEDTLMKKTVYSKEDFFLAVMEVIEKMKGGAA